jgi:mannose-6-phosphate isomerase-like protein (cupin superfamily)
MTDNDVAKTRSELMNKYPGCRVKVAEDKKEMVAEISDSFAVAVIERSVQHFHLKTREVYKVLCGTLYVACEGRGHVLREAESFTIEPGQVHFARAAEEPVWIEVVSTPGWTVEDHFIL